MNGKTRWYCVCDALGVQPNEEFKLRLIDNPNNSLTYKIVIDDEGNDGILLVKSKDINQWSDSSLCVNNLFDGETVVLHLPFIPKDEEEYSYLWFGLDDNCELHLGTATSNFWRLDEISKLRLAQGNCFRSEQEIYNIYGTLENAFQQIYHRPWTEFVEVYNKQRGEKND